MWFKDKVEGWCPSTIVKREDIAGQCKFLVRVTKPNQSTAECQVSSIKDQEVETLKLMNTPEDSEQENLINLPFLHEPALLYCLEQRYYRGLIYTYTGPILIAVNPFKTLDLYSDALLQTYYNFGLQTSRGVTKEALPPHIFAIADAAYNCMVSAVKESSSAGRVADQSILVSGESGAGKTESTKIVLRYLTTIASNSKDVKAAGSIMDKILKSNPILEALGNAKTIRNDNSSRFGKFIELNFDDDGHLVGGHIRTYLLEKVRLISQQLNERNFHIFYQMFTGEPSLVKERWQLPSMHNFNYLNQGKCFHVPDLDDKKDFTALRQAFQTLNFNPTDEGFLFDIVAGLMHLGQIQFTPVELMGEEGSAVLKDATANRSLEVAMKLLGISHKEFIRTVTERAIIARTEVYQKKLTATQASDARDSIARSVYGKLFDWVVATINTEIRGGSSYDVRSEIAVLDIFGFECLSENSFEQLCINYTVSSIHHL